MLPQVGPGGRGLQGRGGEVQGGWMGVGVGVGSGVQVERRWRWEVEGRKGGGEEVEAILKYLHSIIIVSSSVPTGRKFVYAPIVTF